MSNNVITRLMVIYFTTLLVACGGGSGGGDNTQTATPDTDPAVFTFIDHKEAVLDSDITSNVILVHSINQAGNISISAGEYSIDGGGFTAAAGTVSNSQRVKVVKCGEYGC